MEFIKELLQFLLERRKWWLLPVVIAMLLLGIVMFSGGSALAPFIYPLF